ncbi:hypothetical protein EV361DRAFT_759597, partial [Lentinula raphanica]
KDIGQSIEPVIAATHGKRATDHLAKFKPQKGLDEVQAFEVFILIFADAFHDDG